MGYKTNLKFNRKKRKAAKGKRRTARTKRNYATKNWLTRLKDFRISKIRNEKVRKAVYTGLVVIAVTIFVGLVFALSYVQSLTEDLPSPDKPFGAKSAASEIYDRNGNLLYRVFGEENRDPVNIEQMPQLLIWSFLAAEDIDFYKHPGVDVTGLVRCAVRNFTEGEVACGGSTVTQQLIKQTALSDEQKIERKLKEIILALQIERDRDKDEILEMYLTVAPEGSNIYGVTTASRFYFDKSVDELNLAEMAILAAIPQDPSFLSPTKSANPEQAQKRVKARQEYVLDQMERYMDQINDSIKDKTGEENALTQEMIDEAREYKLAYREPRFDIEAPHFVFYAQEVLQERNYLNGEPFSLAELETGGYKITTTLDLDYQQIAEEQVTKGVAEYGGRFGGNNGAMVVMNPKNGEVLSMVGSKDYFGTPSPEGCTLGVDCKFEPSVNITDTLQSPGSSMKPMVYYKSIMEGLITPGSILADIPIKIGNYDPKNYEGGYQGLHSTRHMLAQSRNIPAIYLVDEIGVGNYIDEVKKWGYDTLNNPAGYGPSVAVGGLDIKLIDHAEGYSVFANEGKYTQHEVILKIEDKDGNVVFEYEPQSEEVADPRGVFMVNDMLNGKNGGPGVSWDGRDVAGKTGTSENQQETLFATYTPEIVVIGWLGNNDNTPMQYGASGQTSARPWVSEFLSRIGGSLEPTAFKRPGGITSAGVCSTDEEGGCEGYGKDLALADVKAPALVKIHVAEVCTDQTNKLARDIDIALGKSTKKTFTEHILPNSDLQKYLDEWIKSKEGRENGPPTEYCDKNRNPNNSNKPWAVITAPSAANSFSGTSLAVDVKGYSATAAVTKIEVSLDGTVLGETDKSTLKDTFTITEPSEGDHTFSVKVYDASGAVGTTSITLETLGTVSITSPAGGVVSQSGVTVEYAYSVAGKTLNNATLLVDYNSDGDADQEVSCSGGVCNWTPDRTGGADLTVRGTRKGTTLTSDQVSVIVGP